MSYARIMKILQETEAYRDLDVPVVLSGGDLGIYFINTEKTMQDGGAWNEFKNDAAGMTSHAIKVMLENQNFADVIEYLTEKADELLKGEDRSLCMISGGQTRDWPFSAGVASQLDLPHLALYKQKPGEEDKLEIIDGDEVRPVDAKDKEALLFYTIIHVADLMTIGSSAIREEGGKRMGWVPMVKDREANISDYIVVVDRLQGGRDALKKDDVTMHSFVEIGPDFLRKYSKDPERALEYGKDPINGPILWTKNYLTQHGALQFVSVFNPEGNKLKQARLFFNKYEGVLVQAGKLTELEVAVQKEFSRPIREIIGGEQK